MTVAGGSRDTAARHDWSLGEIADIYEAPIVDLVFRAQTVHRSWHRPNEIQGSTLLSIKTGGCPEDCGYCPQSAHYRTGLVRTPLLDVETAVNAALTAKRGGASRFCMGAAWRSPPSGEEFERVLEMVRHVGRLGLETCCTLGMLSDAQADALAAAGLHAYNHNLDTGPEMYGSIVTTRTYQERLDTLHRVRRAGIHVCSGGIIGMGDDRSVRYSLLQQLARLSPHPESVPINLLVHVEGTPLATLQPMDPMELVRTVATARIMMPGASVRLSAGRTALSTEAHALCFIAGANSIFLGDALLTTANPSATSDRQMLTALGLRLSGTTEQSSES